mgnify:CR=1 FL=1
MHVGATARDMNTRLLRERAQDRDKQWPTRFLLYIVHQLPLLHPKQASDLAVLSLPSVRCRTKTNCQPSNKKETTTSHEANKGNQINVFFRAQSPFRRNEEPRKDKAAKVGVVR